VNGDTPKQLGIDNAEINAKRKIAPKPDRSSPPQNLEHIPHDYSDDEEEDEEEEDEEDDEQEF
jgi:hypothetical protein